jgi:2-methylcitrate dehydratase
MDKLVVHPDDTLTAKMPRYSPNRLTVTLTDGQILTSQVDDLPGFAGRPMTREDYNRKFRSNVKALMHDETIDRFLSIAWSLERQKDMSALLGSLMVQSG